MNKQNFSQFIRTRKKALLWLLLPPAGVALMYGLFRLGQWLEFVYLASNESFASIMIVANPILLLLGIIFALEIVIGIPKSIYYFSKKPEKIKQHNEPIKKLVEDKRTYTFLEFLSIYRKGFVKFAEGNFMKKNPPYLKFLIYSYGVIFGAIVTLLLVDQITPFELVIGGLVLILLLGPMFAFVIYYVNGFIYHIAVFLARGERNMTISRNIIMYANFPFYLMILFIFLFSLVSRIAQIESNIVFSVSMGLFAIAYLYSLILGYLTVIKVHRSNVVASVIIFLVIPIILNII